MAYFCGKSRIMRMNISGPPEHSGKLPISFDAVGGNAKDYTIYGNNEPRKNLLDIGEYDTTSYGLRAFAENGQLRIVGKYTDTSAHTPFRFYTYLEAGDYILSGSPDYSNTGYAIQAGTVTDSSGAGFVSLGYDRGNGLSFTLDSSSWVVSRVYTGVAAYDIDVDFTMPIMLRKSGTSSDFEPYQLGVGERTKNLVRARVGTTSAGITFTVDPIAGTVTANGTATGSAQIRIAINYPNEPNNTTVPPGNYYFSGCPSGGSDNSYNCYSWDYDTVARSNQWDGTTNVETDIGQGNCQVQINGHPQSIVLRIAKDYTANNLVFKPMLRKADTTSDFKPFGYIIPVQSKQRTENHFNKDAQYTVGKYLNASGEEISGSTWGISEFIPIEGGQSYTAYNLSGGAASICWYDYKFRYLGGESYSGLSTKEFALPNEARYVRITIRLLNPSNIDTLMLIKGDVPPEYYIPYYNIKQSEIYIGDSLLTADRSISKRDVETEIVLYKGRNILDTPLYNKPVCKIVAYDYPTIEYAYNEIHTNAITDEVREEEI